MIDFVTHNMGPLMFAGLRFFPAESKASYCKPECGPQGQIYCGGSSCRRPE